jgi:hypothetical protein
MKERQCELLIQRPLSMSLPEKDPYSAVKIISLRKRPAEGRAYQTSGPTSAGRNGMLFPMPR